MTHGNVIKINRRIHQIIRKSKHNMTLNWGKNYAVYYPKANKLVVKHALTGKFITRKVTS